MKLLVGLGNPGTKYEKNRHNIGFIVLEEIIHQLDLPPFQYDKKRKANISQGTRNGHKILAIQPLTFMNLSGESVQAVCSFFKITPENILVYHDEIDLPSAKIKYKVGGGHAGHNGLRSMINRLGSNEFHRIRLGVGRPDDPTHVSDYVLSNMKKEEQEEIMQQIELVQEHTQKFLNGKV